MVYGMQDLARNLVGLPPPTIDPDPALQRSSGDDGLRRDEFWALKDINFDLKRGECLGLIGDNGSGKTTLLRLISGIFPPDAGELAVRGRIGALIALGAGFHPHLSGRENVYLNGSILGMTRDEIDEKYQSIVEFAEIGDFIDAPVSTYSSGMYVRLGFAIAVNTNPDIILVDEILAVGDYNFQEKCMRKMDEIRASNKALIFVTHSLYRIESFCDRAIWLKQGREVTHGTAVDVIRQYLDEQERRLQGDTVRQISATMKPGGQSSPVVITKVEVADHEGTVKHEFPFGSAITVRIHYSASKLINKPLFNFRVFHKGNDIFEAGMLIDGSGPEQIEGEGMVECRFGPMTLTPKVYDIVVFVRTANGAADLCPERTYATFRVSDEALDRIPMRGPYALNHLRQGSPLYLAREWKFYDKKGALTNIVESRLEPEGVTAS